MSREEEYKQKCRQVKDYYLEEICEHEDAGCLGDAENARKWRRAELEELVELARRRAEELGAERPDLHVVFAEDVDQWKANDPFTEIWVVMPWDVDADAFHEVAVWLDSRCRFNE